MECPASATVALPSGTTVHLLGVCHTSAVYGKIAYDLIKKIKPDAVVLEVDESRLREQAHRGQQWVVQQDRESVVRRAVAPFLAPDSLWNALTSHDRSRMAHTLQNEGSALLEGGLYGSEVIMACHAASECGADIVAADRSKALSNARLLEARREQRLRRIQAMPDDDWTLIKHAAGMATARVQQCVCTVLAPLLSSEAHAFAQQLHPIFLVAEEAAHEGTLEAAGCNPARVVAALKRLIHHGSQDASLIEARDLATVQEGIERMERRKHEMRARALAASHAAPTVEPPAARAASPPLPESADQPSTSARHLPALCGALQRLWQREGSDVFSQWCTRGTSRLYSFDVREHADAAAMAELASDGSEPARGAVSPFLRTTIHERDCILAHRIQAVAEEQGTRHVVAVVGANHLPGILKKFRRGPACPAAEAQCASFLSAPRPCSEQHDARDAWTWKLHTVEGLATCMEAGVACAAAYAPVRLMRGAPGPWRWAPLAAAGGLLSASAMLSDLRQRKVAQLVHNLAIHMDGAARQQSAV